MNKVWCLDRLEPPEGRKANESQSLKPSIEKEVPEESSVSWGTLDRLNQKWPAEVENGELGAIDY